MANRELIIDDDYCREMGNFFVEQGEQMDQFVTEYISILQEVLNKAIVSGSTSDALEVYIEYTRRLDKQIGNISEVAKSQVESFLAEVDSADQYLF